MKKGTDKPRRADDKPSKSILEMSVAEIDAHVAKLSRKRGRPLNPAQKQKVQRMRKGPHRSIILADHQIKRGPGRPRIGQGAKEVLISIERGLLEQADAYARAHKLTRSQMIAQALADVIKKAS